MNCGGATGEPGGAGGGPGRERGGGAQLPASRTVRSLHLSDIMRLSRLALAAAAVLSASSAGAQSIPLTATGSDVTGGLDNAWQVQCTQLVGAGSAACGSAAMFTSAVVVTASPGGWTAVPTAGGARYISVAPSASAGGAVGENPRYQYTFRTTFDLTGLNPVGASLTLTNFWLDNYWVGYSLNGAALASGGMDPVPAAPNGANWNRPFTLTIDDGFQSGVNTLDLVITGNGATDGILVEGIITSGTITATPEPATLVLVGSGFAVVGVVARRRRRQG